MSTINAEPAGTSTLTGSTSSTSRRPASAAAPGLLRRLLPFKIADTYLLSEIATNTMRGLGWFGGLLFAFAIITAAREMVRSMLSVTGVLEMLVYQMPRIFLFSLPMSLLFGTVQTFSQMSAEGELTALGAGGMSFGRMLRPATAWALFLAVSAFFVQEVLVPVAEKSKSELLKAQAVKSLKMQENLTWIDQDDHSGLVRRVVQAEGFDPKTKTLLSPSIQIWNEERLVPVQILADQARWDEKAQEWIFYKPRQIINATGQPKTGQPKTGQPDAEQTAQETSAVETVSSEMRIKTDKMPTPELLEGDGAWASNTVRNKKYESVSIIELQRYRAEQQSLLRQIEIPSARRELKIIIQSATFGIHDKIATPLLCLALIFVGAPLGVRPQRSTGGFSMGMSLIVLIVYYVVWTAVTQMGKSGLADPILMAYLPLALTTVIGAILVFLKTR